MSPSAVARAGLRARCNSISASRPCTAARPGNIESTARAASDLGYWTIVVSDACTELCVHEQDALVHAVGDVDALTRHLTLLDEDRGRLAELRGACLTAAPTLTWATAGRQLLQVYEEVASAGPR